MDTKLCHVNSKDKNDTIAILASDKEDVKTKRTTINKEIKVL